MGGAVERKYQVTSVLLICRLSTITPVSVVLITVSGFGENILMFILPTLLSMSSPTDQ
jgi:hypothetical protein